ncbi:MAG TPA: hypothetical protein VFV10_12585 [Gammaproteobacteria bacterium]|nr:hypothetical protein [Gammaproteobacteria bacterium]
MGAVPGVALVFLAVAVVFLGMTLRSYLLEVNAMTPARGAWLRTAFIFSAVTVGLFVLGTFAG